MNGKSVFGIVIAVMIGIGVLWLVGKVLGWLIGLGFYLLLGAVVGGVLWLGYRKFQKMLSSGKRLT